MRSADAPPETDVSPVGSNSKEGQRNGGGVPGTSASQVSPRRPPTRSVGARRVVAAVNRRELRRDHPRGQHLAHSRWWRQAGIGVLMFGKVFASTVADDTTPEEFAGAGAFSRSEATELLPPTTSFGLTAIGNGPVVAQTSLKRKPSAGGRRSQPSAHSCLKVQVPSWPTGFGRRHAVEQVACRSELERDPLRRLPDADAKAHLPLVLHVEAAERAWTWLRRQAQDRAARCRAVCRRDRASNASPL